MSKKQSNFLTGKAFYIILFVCVAAIGVSGYALFFGTPEEEPAEETFNWLPSSQPVISPSKQPVLPPKTVENPTVYIPEEDTVSVLNPVTEIVIPSPQNIEMPKASIAPTTPTSVPKPKKVKFFWPLSGEIIKAHSLDMPVYNETLDKWRTHSGIDINAELGSHVMASADGTVVEVDNNFNSGTYVIIDHGNGLKSFYSNLQASATVVLDQKVMAGDIIGGVGDTSGLEKAQTPHLHFEITKDGADQNPSDYLPKN